MLYKNVHATKLDYMALPDIINLIEYALKAVFFFDSLTYEELGKISKHNFPKSTLLKALVENDTESASKKKAVIVMRMKKSGMQCKHGRFYLIETIWESLCCREISVILDKTFDDIWSSLKRFRMFCNETMTKIIMRISRHFSVKRS